MRLPRRRSGRRRDDEALEHVARRLRVDDPADPPYQPGRFAQLASAGLVSERGPSDRRLVGSRVRSPLMGGRGIGSFGLALVMVIGLVALRLNDGSQTGTSPSPAASDLLSQVRAAGVLRVAIRPDFPQATTDRLAGFDVDVASALATRLGVRLEIVIVEAPTMASPTSFGDWDVAMPSSSLVATTAQFASSDAYYAFPAFLVVSDGSAAQTPADLAGARICVVAGSAGQAWMGGRYLGAVVPAPSGGPAVRVGPDDQACLDALNAGEVDAIVTAALSSADIGVRSSVRVLGQPVLVEPRSIVVRFGGSDPSALLDAIDAAVAGMRANGTLADLSRNRFGGQDLSVP